MIGTTKIMTMNFIQMFNVYRGIENVINNLPSRIIMEKEQKGLSYKDLCNELQKLDAKMYSDFSEDKLRKNLGGKKPDMQLILDLCIILEIEDNNTNLLEAIATYRYFLNKEEVGRGRTSQKEIDNRKERYKKIYDELKLSDGDSLEKTIYNVFSTKEKHSYNGIECDWEMYREFMEEDIKKEMLKKILVINEYCPDEVEEFIDTFVFDDECNAELEKLDVDIKYL
jgi:hypothetical protein